MALKKKISRKELLKQPDEFISLWAQAANFVRRQSRAVLGALVVLAAAAVFLVALHFHRQNEQERANLLERSAYRAFHGRVIDQDEASGENLPPEETFTSPRERYRSAQAKYRELLEKHPGTPQARRARFYLGLCAYHLGEYDRARRIYQELLEQSAPESPWYRQALHNLGYALEQAGEYSQAAATYQELLDLVPGHRKPIIYLDIARAYEQAKAWDKARQVYEQLQGLALDERQQRMVAQRLGRLEAAAKAQVGESGQGG